MDTENHRLTFEYSPLPGRKKLVWQNSAHTAVWIVINIEHFQFGKSGPAIQPHLVSQPEIANYSWRDYGNRIGIWRLFELFDQFPNLKITAALNSDICLYYPEIIEAVTKRGWELMGHGINNSLGHSGLDEAAEQNLITQALSVIEKSCGVRPKGWLTPGFSVTSQTTNLLQKAGITYLADWVNDDQPYFINLNTGKMVVIPYTLEANDITLCLSARCTGPEFSQALRDQFDQLYSEGENGTGNVFTLGLHPFIVGQPLRLKYLKEVITHIAAQPGIWSATGLQIAEHFAKASI